MQFKHQRYPLRDRLLQLDVRYLESRSVDKQHRGSLPGRARHALQENPVAEFEPEIVYFTYARAGSRIKSE
jgi:hypothetical protein